ncbi:MAG: hypothetical protein ACTSPO_15870 [Candidatus Heimdallarchaeaceae archaeon]
MDADDYLRELRLEDLESLREEFCKSSFSKENLQELKAVRGKLKQFLRFVEIEISTLEVLD